MPILIVAVLVILGAAAAGGGAAVYGQAPQCASEPGEARSATEIGATLANAGRVVVDEREATTLTRGYIGSVVADARVCFTPGAAHLSGKVPLGPVTPSFYATLGVEFVGTQPRATDLDVKVGALPSVPGVSDVVKRTISDLINQSLAQWKIDQPYAAEFASGSATIAQLPR